MATGTTLELRPARPADRERVVEICAGIWEGHDYVPEVFEAWVRDPSGTFQVGEVDGEVVALQRIRPLSREAVWYEGLRVAQTHRRLGIARQMLTAAVGQTSSMGFQEMRLATADSAPRALFESAGFRLLLQPDLMRARRLEGLEAARMPDPDQADRLFPGIQADPAYDLYAHLHVEWDGAYDLTAEELARRAEQGQVRITAGGRALAIVDSNPRWGFLSVRFLAGSGAALRDLAAALRFEADLEGLDHVRIWVPEGHPAVGDLQEVGYDFRTELFRLYFYALRLPS